MYLGRGAETGSGWDNLHVGAVSRHRLDSLNTSTELLIIIKSTNASNVHT